MSVRSTLAKASRVLAQLRNDHRSVALLLVARPADAPRRRDVGGHRGLVTDLVVVSSCVGGLLALGSVTLRRRSE